MFIVRVGKIIFLKLLGSLFRKKKGIRIANQDFIIPNRRGQQGGKNGKLLRSPSNRSHPRSINGFVALACGKKPQEFQYLGKGGCCSAEQRIKCQEQRGGSSFWGGSDDQLGWLCVILIIPQLATRGKKHIPENIFRVYLSAVKPHYLGKNPNITSV